MALSKSMENLFLSIASAVNVVKKFLIKAVQEISEDEFEAEEDKSFNEKKVEVSAKDYQSFFAVIIQKFY